MNPRIFELTPPDVAQLDNQRRWVISHYSSDGEVKYASVPGKLKVLDVILQSGWVEPTETEKMQCLAAAFGDALAQEIGGKWVRVEEDTQIEYAVQLGRGGVLIYPLALLARRMENGAFVEVKSLFNDLCALVRKQSNEFPPDTRIDSAAA